MKIHGINYYRKTKILITTISCFLFVLTLASHSKAEWKTLFQDDFENRDLSPWTFSIEPDSPTPAGWEVVNDSGNNVFRGRGHSWAELVNKYWRNYNLTFRIKIITGQIHINVRLGDNGRYLILLANNYLSIEKESPWGSFTPLGFTSCTIHLNEWYYVEVQINSGSIKVYLNNNKILTAQDSEYLVNGGIGFETLGEANVWTSDVLIDDVNVTGEAGGSISGMITSQGAPVAHIPVQAFSDPCQYYFLTEAYTDSSGRYTLEDLPDGNVYLRTCASCDHLNYLDEWYNGQEGTQSCALATPITITNGSDVNDIYFSLIKGPKQLLAFDLALYNNELHTAFFTVYNFRKLLVSATLSGPNSFFYQFDLQKDAIHWDSDCRSLGTWYYHNFGDFNVHSYSYGTYKLTLTYCNGSKKTYLKELKETTPPVAVSATSMHYQKNEDGSVDFYWDPPDPAQVYQLRIRDSEERELFYESNIPGTQNHLHVYADDLRCIEPGKTYKWFLRSYNEPIDYSFGIAAYSAVGESERKDFIYSLPEGLRRTSFWVGDWLEDLFMDVFVRPGSLKNVSSARVVGPDDFEYSFDINKDWFDLSTETRFFRGWWHNFRSPIIYGNYQLYVQFLDGHTETLAKSLEQSSVTPVDSNTLKFVIHQDGAITFSWVTPTGVYGQYYKVKIRNLSETKEYYSSPSYTDVTMVTASSWTLRSLDFGSVYKWAVRTYNPEFNTGRQTGWLYFRYNPFDIACVPDTDKDGDVDGVDVVNFIKQLGSNGCPDNCITDFDVDGTVGLSDIAILAKEFGRSDCPRCGK